MTRKETNTYLVVGGIAAVGLYLISKNKREQMEAQQRRQNQLMNRNSGQPGSGGGQFFNTVLDLFKNRKKKTGGKTGGLTFPTTGYNANATDTSGMATNLGLDPNNPFNIDGGTSFTP